MTEERKNLVWRGEGQTTKKKAQSLVVVLASTSSGLYLNSFQYLWVMVSTAAPPQG